VSVSAYRTTNCQQPNKGDESDISITTFGAICLISLTISATALTPFIRFVMRSLHCCTRAVIIAWRSKNAWPMIIPVTRYNI
jgi:hypothetical protein